MAIRIIFQSVVQDAPEFGSTEEHSVSRVYFDLEVDGEIFNDLYVNVQQPVGGSHTTEEIRVGNLKAVLLPLNQNSFKRAVSDYYRSLVTSSSFGKHLAKDKGFRTHKDELGMEQQVVEL